MAHRARQLLVFGQLQYIFGRFCARVKLAYFNLLLPEYRYQSALSLYSIPIQKMVKYSSHGLFGANVYRWRINIGTRNYGLSLYRLIKILIIKLVVALYQTSMKNTSVHIQQTKVQVLFIQDSYLCMDTCLCITIRYSQLASYIANMNEGELHACDTGSSQLYVNACVFSYVQLYIQYMQCYILEQRVQCNTFYGLAHTTLRICMHGSYSFNFFHECKICYQCTQHLTITPIVHVCIPIISSASSCDNVN